MSCAFGEWLARGPKIVACAGAAKTASARAAGTSVATRRRRIDQGAKARAFYGTWTATGDYAIPSARSHSSVRRIPSSYGTRGSQPSWSRALAADTVPRRSRKVGELAVNAGGFPRSLAQRSIAAPLSSRTGRGRRRASRPPAIRASRLKCSSKVIRRPSSQTAYASPGSPRSSASATASARSST